MNRTTRRKVRVGSVVSDRMDKTIVVTVNEYRPHPIYKKHLRRTKRFKVHDEGNIAKIGDKVSIMETRPLSKDKRWRLCEVMHKNN